MAWTLSSHVRLANDRITDADAYRQQATAAEICRRLNDQPGLVLADEVGMGKTFVAFAVAVSVLHSTGRRRPVVVMIPPAVSEKWPRDWSVFEQRCLLGGPAIRATTRTVERGSEFLKLLDDGADRQAHLIFLKHGALSRTLNDPFIRLAIVREAFRYQRRLTTQLAAFPRWAGRLLGDGRFTPNRTRTLLKSPPATWAHEWERLGMSALEDDPVPKAILRGLRPVDLGQLRKVLADVPLRRGAHIERRVGDLRDPLRDAVETAWAGALRNLGERLPLLVLDEAHHTKNPNSLARLFDSPEALRDADAVSGGGALANVFERMLFLTATPFQLGHRELINVLGRFAGTKIGTAAKVGLRSNLDQLGVQLDTAQACLAPTQLAKSDSNAAT